jgi:hypothetical protein
MTFERLHDPTFIRSVLAESRSRSAPVAYRRHSDTAVDRISAVDDFVEDSDDDRPKRGRKVKKWKPAEIERLRGLITVHGPKWKLISAQMKKRTAWQCQRCAIAKNFTEDVRSAMQKVQRMVSVTFVRGEERFPVGYRPTRFDEAKFLNPLPGAIDPVTNAPMTMPALSPDGYVCDYTTWMRIFAETKVNPFTQRPIRSKRELVVLTIDNFPQYRDRIVNLDLAELGVAA